MRWATERRRARQRAALLALILSTFSVWRPVSARSVSQAPTIRAKEEFAPTRPLSIDPNTQLCWPLLQRNTKGASVKTLQKLLALRGYAMPVDGKFGYGTEATVRKFQRARRLKQDGMVGWQTWTALFPALHSGSRGASVRLLQTLLNGYGHGVPQVRVDGIYGASTQRAVTKLRASLGASSGAADAVVWCHLAGGMFTPFE